MRVLGREQSWLRNVDNLTAFGLFAVTAMLVCHSQ
jgi:hypothetical protein